MASLLIRPSRPDDLPAIQTIYAHHVLHGVASFETEPPDVATLAARRDDVLAIGAPHLVAERDGQVLGFGYANRYRPRAAYRHTVENSIYLDEAARGQGVGRALLAELIAQCRQAGFRQMIAVIGGGPENPASIGVHAKLGFTLIGTLTGVGYKFDRWLDTTLMQLAL